MLIAIAQAPFADAEVEFYVDSRTNNDPLTVGDQLTLRLEIAHPAESRVSLPQVDREWGGFHVVEQSSPEAVEHGDGTATTFKNIVVTLFQPGLYKTPDLAVTHRRPDGQIEDLAAPVIMLRVTSVITDSEDIELRDLKEQAYLPVPVIWPWIVGGVVGTVLLLALITWAVWWFYWRRRKKDEEVIETVPPPVIDTRPPEVIAYAELERIQQLGLPKNQQIKEHYSLVSDCMREYVENRYNIPALEQTTTEINHNLRRNELSTSHVSRFMGILSQSDLVKFARYEPTSHDTESLIEKARSAVALTTPAPAEPDPPADSPPLEKSP